MYVSIPPQYCAQNPTHHLPQRPSRPLPDERPRQSVANLIGRFETQSKRQPATGTSSPRSSSIVSHITGDSVKEELKEKREWPPKSVTESADVPFEPPTLSRFIKSPVIQPVQPEVQPEPEPEPQPVKTEILPAPAETTMNGTSESKASEIPPVPEPPKAEPEIKEPIVSPKSPTSKTRTIPKPAQTPRTSPSVAQKAAITRMAPSSNKAPAKAPSSSPLNRPQKPQQTSQPAPTIKKSPLKPSVATAPRPKTPIRTTVPISKSSNLYAPTAASLARARGAPSPAPTPVKKPSSNVLERLSKPTASSLSRARSPATSPPAKPATLPRTSSAPRPSRGTPVSARGGKTPATPSKTRQAKVTSPTGTQEEETGRGGAVISATASNGIEEGVFASGPLKGAQAVSPLEPAPEAEVAAEGHQDDVVPLIGLESQVVEPEESQARNEEVVSPEPEVPQGHHLKREENASETTLAAGDLDQGDTADPISDKLTALASKHDDTDIEQIMNLLETVPLSRPVSIATPPSDIMEIPDEEH